MDQSSWALEDLGFDEEDEPLPKDYVTIIY